MLHTPLQVVIHGYWFPAGRHDGLISEWTLVAIYDRHDIRQCFLLAVYVK